MALSNQRQVEKLNKKKNTSTEEETLSGLQSKDHSLQPSTLDIICKRSTQRKRVTTVSKENTQCKCIKISDEIKKKSICTMSKKEESLLGKIKLMIGERIDILNIDFFNQKLESLNRRIEQVQCKKPHEEIAKTFLKKVSKLERRINAVLAFQEEVFSKMALHQTMLPSADCQNTVLNQPGPSAFCPGIINIPTSSSNTLLLSPYTGFTSAHVSEYISSDEVILVSVENQNSATADNSAIPNNQMSTQAEMSATVQSEMKEQKLKVIDLTEENHNCSKDDGVVVTEESLAPATSILFGRDAIVGEDDAVRKSGVLISESESCSTLSRNSATVLQTFKQFPHLPLLPRIPLCPELAEEFKDPPRNPEIESGLCAKFEGDCTVMDPYRN